VRIYTAHLDVAITELIYLFRGCNAVQWIAMHGRRMLCSTSGRLVLVDLDDLERRTNQSMIIKGVAVAPVHSACGFIGTGTGTAVHSARTNGFSVDSAWVGVGGRLMK
jgi:hypothetical protein